MLLILCGNGVSELPSSEDELLTSGRLLMDDAAHEQQPFDQEDRQFDGAEEAMWISANIKGVMIHAKTFGYLLVQNMDSTMKRRKQLRVSGW